MRSAAPQYDVVNNLKTKNNKKEIQNANQIIEGSEMDWENLRMRWLLLWGFVEEFSEHSDDDDPATVYILRLVWKRKEKIKKQKWRLLSIGFWFQDTEEDDDG